MTKEQICLSLQGSLIKKLKIRAIEEGTTASLLVEQFIKDLK